MIQIFWWREMNLIKVQSNFYFPLLYLNFSPSILVLSLFHSLLWDHGSFMNLANYVGALIA